MRSDSALLQRACAHRSVTNQRRKMKQQEPDDNILLSCPGKCSKDTYFLIKKLEKKRSMKDYVYVNFKYRKQREGMWVRISKGDQQRGEGRLDNIPRFLPKLRLHQLVKFRTGADGVTWGRGT